MLVLLTVSNQLVNIMKLKSQIFPLEDDGDQNRVNIELNISGVCKHNSKRMLMLTV